MIDLRSDTATHPTSAMREAMASASVGDEQLREDPTVNALQEKVAALFGKEAALFLPSGTMCNAIVVCVHSRRGEAIILDFHSHIANSEAGGPGFLAGVLLRTIHGARGIFTAADVEPLLHKGSLHNSRTSLIAVENTNNAGGGSIWPVEHLRDLRDMATRHGLAFHMDGARVINAVVASGVPAATYGSLVDTIWIDLSKGLGAPVGAVLAGSREFIEQARRYKHLFGGAMRQAGIIAAAGIYALDHHIERLAEDHANAQYLAEELCAIPGVRLVNGPVETNILYIDIEGTGVRPLDLVQPLREAGIALHLPFTGSVIRLVTHLGISRADCQQTVAAFRSSLIQNA